MIKTKFTGKSLKIAIKNTHACYENAIGFIIDGNITGKVIIEEHNKNIVLDVAEGLSEGVHDLILFKRSDAAHYFDFYGVILEKGCNFRYSQHQKVIEELNVLEIQYQLVKFQKL